MTIVAHPPLPFLKVRSVRAAGFLLFLGLLTVPGLLFPQSDGRKVLYGVPPVVCHISGESGHARVGPPAGFLDSLKSASKKSDLIVTYKGFPDSVRNAFEYAVSIWESVVSSSIPIYVEARWEKLGSTTLGSCGATSYHIDFEGAPEPDTWYPVALAEKITGREISGAGVPDMVASFNSSQPWYTGTDLNTPYDRYDFVSTVLHEIAHGLGFVGFFEADLSARTGSFGYGDMLPAAFDRKVEDAEGRLLTNGSTYGNPSAALYYSFVSNHLYARSPAALLFDDGQKPRLYAPQTFKEGSSIYHLNDQSYPYGTINALMTSSAGRGEAIHSPGPLTTGILADLGWTHLWIRHTPLKDREETSAPLVFEASVESEAGLTDSLLTLLYSYDGFGSHRDTLLMPMTGSPGQFLAELFPDSGIVTLSYFLAATDTLGRNFTSPAGAPGRSWKLTLGPDTVKPLILHTPEKYLLTTAPQLEITAIVTDNAGVDTVYAQVYLNGNELMPVGLKRESENSYRGLVPLENLFLKGGELLEYKIVAIDIAGQANRRELPEKGKFGVKTEGILQPVSSYSADFSSQSADFILYDFSVSLVNGFTDHALHSPHPYPSPDADNQQINLTALLRIPILVRGNGKIAWEEVVLVEPGEEEARYGSEDFYDYVIAEGSRDGGLTWLPLLNGYDSGSRPAWKSAYNQRISGQNSLFAGTRELYYRREFLLTGNGNFREGDTLLIRFRLYSDPYAHGWGWAIDNLEIQQNLTPAGAVVTAGSGFRLWPNPAGPQISLLMENAHPAGGYALDITDLSGRILLTLPPEKLTPGTPATIRLDHLPPGLYFARLKQHGRILETRKFVRR